MEPESTKPTDVLFRNPEIWGSGCAVEKYAIYLPTPGEMGSSDAE